jgi:hypothetical protein
MSVERSGGRRTAWVVGLALAVVLAGAAAVVAVRVGWAYDPGRQAEEAYRKGDWDRAAHLARARLRIDPNDLDSVRMLARASARLGRLDTAMALYNKRLGAEMMQTEDFFLLGQALAQAGRAEMAMQIWNKAAQTPPDHPEMLDGLARLQATQGRIEEGADAASRLAKVPGWEARGLLILGTCRAMMDDWAGAAEALERGLKLDPEARGAPYPPEQYRKILARALLCLGRPAEARPHLQHVLASGADPEASWYESRADIQEGKFEQAAAAIETSGKFRDDHPAMAEPGPYVGSAACESCHPSITEKYRHARHARTFYHGAGLLKLPRPDRPLPDPDDPGVTHTIETEGEAVRALTRVDDKTYRVVVDFAFGTPERYLSMVAATRRGRTGRSGSRCTTTRRETRAGTGPPATWARPTRRRASGVRRSTSATVSCAAWPAT